MIDQYDCGVNCVICGELVALMHTYKGDYETCSKACHDKKLENRKNKIATMTPWNNEYYDKEGNLLKEGDLILFEDSYRKMSKFLVLYSNLYKQLGYSWQNGVKEPEVYESNGKRYYNVRLLDLCDMPKITKVK